MENFYKNFDENREVSIGIIRAIGTTGSQGTLGTMGTMENAVLWL